LRVKFDKLGESNRKLVTEGPLNVTGDLFRVLKALFGGDGLTFVESFLTLARGTAHFLVVHRVARITRAVLLAQVYMGRLHAVRDVVQDQIYIFAADYAIIVEVEHSKYDFQLEVQIRPIKIEHQLDESTHVDEFI
jgi:hypothetical protein